LDGPEVLVEIPPLDYVQHRKSLVLTSWHRKCINPGSGHGRKAAVRNTYEENKNPGSESASFHGENSTDVKNTTQQPQLQAVKERVFLAQPKPEN
jgi:hypothetical protein